MRSQQKTKNMASQHAALDVENPTMMKVLAQTIKTGIIKSNLITMIAGLMLAMYTYHVNPFDEKLAILLAIAGTAAVIGGAGAFNNWYDRDIDAKMRRTQKRPTVTGEVSPVMTLVISFTLLLAGLGMLYIASPMAALLGFLGWFFYVVPYTMWTKRHTVYNTEVGSLSGAMPPLIGWGVVSNDIFHPAIISLFIIELIWQMPHFYAIAIRKMEDYRAAGVPMLPVAKGMKRTYVTTNVYLVILILCCIPLGSLSTGLMLVAIILSAVWLVLNIYGYHRKDPKKWANLLFVYSLLHMVILFSTVILYALIGLYLDFN